MIAAAEAMLAGGARILQFRHKGHYSRQVFEQAEKVAELCRRAGALFVIDDRADIAILLDAGVHVGQDDLPPQDARRLVGPGRLLGFSTHNETQLRAAASRAGGLHCSWPDLRNRLEREAGPGGGRRRTAQTARARDAPLVAIGGITRENALAVLEAGADSVAVIGDLLPAECNFKSMRERMEQWQKLVK